MGDSTYIQVTPTVKIKPQIQRFNAYEMIFAVAPTKIWLGN